MVAVYLAPGSMALGWGQLLVMALMLVVFASFLGQRSKPLAIVVLVGGALGLGASAALAIPYYYCDPIWKWMGWC